MVRGREGMASQWLDQIFPRWFAGPLGLLWPCTALWCWTVLLGRMGQRGLGFCEILSYSKVFVK